MTEDIPVRIRTKTRETTKNNIEPIRGDLPIRFRSRHRPTLDFENYPIDQRYALPDKLEITFDQHSARNTNDENIREFLRQISHEDSIVALTIRRNRLHIDRHRQTLRN